mmetsp:Transcript_5731/g.18392  ORF Transcript_5731/g.18392 Transcript_5731/m.18392 type:complete len:316 (-) Transcript_5731:3-950(-)
MRKRVPSSMVLSKLGAAVLTSVAASEVYSDRATSAPCDAGMLDGLQPGKREALTSSEKSVLRNAAGHPGGVLHGAAGAAAGRSRSQPPRGPGVLLPGDALARGRRPSRGDARVLRHGRKAGGWPAEDLCARPEGGCGVLPVEDHPPRLLPAGHPLPPGRGGTGAGAAAVWGALRHLHDDDIVAGRPRRPRGAAPRPRPVGRGLLPARRLRGELGGPLCALDQRPVAVHAPPGSVPSYRRRGEERSQDIHAVLPDHQQRRGGELPRQLLAARREAQVRGHDAGRGSDGPLQALGAEPRRLRPACVRGHARVSLSMA